MVTLTPSNAVGIWLFTKSEPSQLRTCGASFDPIIDTQVFGEITGLLPKALPTKVITGAGDLMASTVAVSLALDEFEPPPDTFARFVTCGGAFEATLTVTSMEG